LPVASRKRYSALATGNWRLATGNYICLSSLFKSIHYTIRVPRMASGTLALHEKAFLWFARNLKP
jgi:hypothetical protein